MSQIAANTATTLVRPVVLEAHGGSEGYVRVTRTAEGWDAELDLGGGAVFPLTWAGGAAEDDDLLVRVVLATYDLELGWEAVAPTIH